ncbi:MAG: 2-dehydropantoate 2-reductase, partial [Staphylococcus equorum]|nr:2-dehydropantoate 2-reductase [Staphylococcus equorum]
SKISDNVFKSIWTKATLNSVLNPLCSILGKKIGEFASYNESRSMIKLIIEEIVEVANKKGIDLDVKSMINKIESSYPENAQGLHYPSMYHDLKSGRLTEIDFLNGQIADYGSELGIPTPINKMMKHMIHQLENKN